MDTLLDDTTGLDEILDKWGITKHLKSKKDEQRLNILKDDIMNHLQNNLPDKKGFRQKLEKRKNYKVKKHNMMRIRSVKEAIAKSIELFENVNPFPDMLILITDLEPVPKSVKEVKKSQYWLKFQEAMKAKMNSHHKMGTFGYKRRSEVSLGKKILWCKWVFDYKLDILNGVLLKFKAHIVAVGSGQKE
ncbi:hypothetical protein HDU83_006732, partial [Entophlyctis luteolus]